jgi:Secretion system C-terminal sorting domain
MKRTIHFLSALLFTLFINSLLLAQNPIPNSGFESWSGLEILGWTHNSTSFIPTVVQTTDAFSGSFAVRGEVIDVAGAGFPPNLFTGTFQDPRFPVTQNFQTFTGQYKFGSQGGDKLLIVIVFINENIGGGADGNAEIEVDATSYTEISIPMVYDDNNPPGWIPTHGNITVTILPPTGQAPHIGTYFLVDDFTFDGQPVSVEKEIGENIPNDFSLQQNYPNPFNPSTNINFSVPEESFVTLKVYNVQGEEIADLVNENLSTGNYNVNWDASALPSGVYVYMLRAKDIYLSRKMILMK